MAFLFLFRLPRFMLKPQGNNSKIRILYRLQEPELRAEQKKRKLEIKLWMGKTHLGLCVYFCCLTDRYLRGTLGKPSSVVTKGEEPHESTNKIARQKEQYHMNLNITCVATLRNLEKRVTAFVTRRICKKKYKSCLSHKASHSHTVCNTLTLEESLAKYHNPREKRKVASREREKNGFI